MHDLSPSECTLGVPTNSWQKHLHQHLTPSKAFHMSVECLKVVGYSLLDLLLYARGFLDLDDLFSARVSGACRTRHVTLYAVYVRAIDFNGDGIGGR